MRSADSCSNRQKDMAGNSIHLLFSRWPGRWWCGLADRHASGSRRFRRGLPGVACGAWMVVFATLTIVLFVTKTGANISRGWILLWVASVLIFLTASRLVLLALVYRWRDEHRLQTRVAVYGTGPEGQRFVQAPLTGYPDKIARGKKHHT